ncbi:MAG: Mur ligase family protein [bacterium]|nr:Mur ligase family protein [bacterium]
MRIDIGLLKKVFKNFKLNKKITFNNVVFDSRLATKGSIFFALKGKKDDGHNYAMDAIKNGAKCVVVEREVNIPNYVVKIKVKNTYHALIKLAEEVRNYYNPNYSIAIAGSNGKTTVKEMISHILSSSYTIFKTPGNMNSQVGLTTSFINAPKRNYEVLVFEVGATQIGDITKLSNVTKHNVAVLTGIGVEHLESFGSFKNIKKAELEVVNTCRGNLYIYNENLKLKRGYSFGEKQADIRLLWYKRSFPVEYAFEFNGKTYKSHISLIGKHNILNGLCAIITSKVCGVDVEIAANRLKSFEPVSGRGKIYKNSILIYDESYNSNPSSLKTSLEAFFEFFKGKNIIIIGDMLELGKYSIFFMKK